MDVRYLIVGAGPAGLGAAYRLGELGERDFLVVEREPWVGGLAASFRDREGFTWDIGGQVQFSHYSYFDQVMDEALPESEWLSHERESWVWSHGRFVPYPFQNNIRFLPKHVMWRCLRGMVAAQTAQGPAPRNFRDWILRTFGRGMAEEFMLPYNFKVWGYPAEQLSYQWIGDRVSVVDLETVLENVIFERTDASWGPNNKFRFPRKGGTGAVWESVADRIGRENMLLRSPVVSISPRTREATLASGATVSYEYLFSTMPLAVLGRCVEDDIPAARAATGLCSSASHIVGIGVEGKLRDDLRTKCWMYFPEPTTPFYRVTVFSNYSANNVPDAERCFSLMCETSESAHKPVRQATIIEETVAGLRRCNLLSPEDKIVSRWHYRAPFAYPTPSLGRDWILSGVVPALEAHNIYSRGRFGAWSYEVSNQDHTFMQGVEWADRIVLGEEERTFRIKRHGEPANQPPRRARLATEVRAGSAR